MKSSNENKKNSTPPSIGKTKKLIQSRLSFKLLPKTPTNVTENRKRKLSVDDDNRNVKIGRKSLDLDTNEVYDNKQSDSEDNPLINSNSSSLVNLNCQEKIDDDFSLDKTENANDLNINYKLANQDPEVIIIDLDPIIPSSSDDYQSEPILSDNSSIEETSVKIIDETLEEKDQQNSVLIAAKKVDETSTQNINEKSNEISNQKLDIILVNLTEDDELVDKIKKDDEIIEVDQQENSITEDDDDSLTEVTETSANEKKNNQNKKRENLSEPDVIIVEQKRPKIIDNNELLVDDAKLTPKQISKRLENEKKKEERQKIKEEKDRKLQEEKELRQKDKEDKEKIRKKEREEKEEQRKKEREEKEEAKRKEKEEKEKKRLEEVKQKNDERKKKEIEEETRKKRASDAFTKFFKNSKTDPRLSNGEEIVNSCSNDDGIKQNQNFMPFRIKENMKLAPTVRRILTDEEKVSMEKMFLENNPTGDLSFYRNCLKNGKGHSERTWIPNLDRDDLIIIDDEIEASSGLIEESKPKEIFRAKFLMFKENQRPPYYGTWRKHSDIVRPRRPFASDTKFFDYEVDSDDEWEEDEPGESLNGSDDEKDKESEDDYEVDNEFFVPHGYLSDEENNEECIEDDNSPETQKAKLKILQQEFAAEMKKKTEKIKPRLIGCIWENSIGEAPETCPKVIWDLLFERSMVSDNSISFKKPEILINTNSISPEDKTQNKKLKTIPDDEIKDLIRLIHGNTNNRRFLTKEFIEFLKVKKNKDCDASLVDGGGEEQIKEHSKRMISHKISEIAKWGKYPEQGPMYNKFCWHTSNEYLEIYNLKDILTLPNTWNYTLQPTRIEITTKTGQNNDNNEIISVSDPLNINETIEPCLNLEGSDSINKVNIVKKRVPILMSVPCGEIIPQKVKNNLISKFLQIGTKNDNVKTGDDDIQIITTTTDPTKITMVKDNGNETKTQEEIIVLE